MMEDSLFAYVKWCPVKQAASQFPMKDATQKSDSSYNNCKKRQCLVPSSSE